MLSEKLITYFKSRNWWFDESTEDYKNALMEIGVDLESGFAQFYLHVEDGPTFLARRREIYQVCWFMINSNDYKLAIQRTHEVLKLPAEYIPLDSFEGEYGYFYNLNTDEVLRLGLGQEWHDFMKGTLKPQWESFNSFLEWFFELAD